MRKAHWGSLKFYSLLLLSLAAIMMFVPSCTQEESIERPSARFVLNGTVLSDPENQPQKDFLVILYHETKKLDSLAVDSLDMLIDSAITNVDGTFKVIDSLGIPAESVYNLAFIDNAKVTKSSNASIDTYLTTYKFEDLKFSNGDGHWYAGEIFKTEIFKLEIEKR